LEEAFWTAEKVVRGLVASESRAEALADALPDIEALEGLELTEPVRAQLIGTLACLRGLGQHPTASETHRASLGVVGLAHLAGWEWRVR
jgi:hypothetical protein